MHENMIGNSLSPEEAGECVLVTVCYRKHKDTVKGSRGLYHKSSLSRMRAIGTVFSDNYTRLVFKPEKKLCNPNES